MAKNLEWDNLVCKFSFVVVIGFILVSIIWCGFQELFSIWCDLRHIILVVIFSYKKDSPTLDATITTPSRARIKEKSKNF